MYLYANVFLPNGLHTMINEGENKYVVFSHCRQNHTPGVHTESLDPGPSLYFYDIIAQKEVVKIHGGEALIDYKYNEDK